MNVKPRPTNVGMPVKTWWDPSCVFVPRGTERLDPTNVLVSVGIYGKIGYDRLV